MHPLIKADLTNFSGSMKQPAAAECLQKINNQCKKISR